MTHKVCHLSTVHPADDARILYKECVSLAQAGYDVSLIVPRAGDDVISGVRRLALPKPASRGERISRTAAALFWRARTQNADLYHFHDPELFGVGLALKALGAKVVFDSHEDLPRQLGGKPWIPAQLRGPAAWLAERIEDGGARWLDAVIGATPTITARFAARGLRATTVNNYPILGELSGPAAPYADRPEAALYVGGVTAIRGAREMVAAAAQAKTPLRIAGPVSGAGLSAELRAAPGVDLLGVLDRAGVGEALRSARLGLCVLWPQPNYLESTPVKLFEYLAAGLPVVASDFPRWRELIGDSDSVRFVDPKDPNAIAAAIHWILSHPAEAQAMGERGRAHVHAGYHWGVEEAKLLALYAELLGG